MSLPARGVWIEIKTRLLRLRDSCRSPQGECGLKFPTFHRQHGIAGRSPQGECGLKYVGQLHGLLVAGRSPQGECGLK